MTPEMSASLSLARDCWKSWIFMLYPTPIIRPLKPQYSFLSNHTRRLTNKSVTCVLSDEETAFGDLF